MARSIKKGENSGFGQNSFRGLKIWGVDSEGNLKTNHMNRDRCSLGAPGHRSPLWVWDWALPAPPSPPGDILLSRICKSIPHFPWPTQGLWSWGSLMGVTHGPHFLWHVTVHHFFKHFLCKLCTGPWGPCLDMHCPKQSRQMATEQLKCG